MTLSDRAVELIISAEGLDQPWKWPGGASGITIGIGYDLGHVTEEQFRRDWERFLQPEELDELSTVIGLTGGAARMRAPQFDGIEIKRADAMEVFHQRTLPVYFERTKKAFPGLDTLPLDAQGALVSLVFNRGASMEGPRRKEMAAIRDLVRLYAATPDPKHLKAIADQIRSMKRLWEGQGLGGLLKRRDAEARLVESTMDEACAPAVVENPPTPAVDAEVRNPLEGLARVAETYIGVRENPRNSNLGKDIRRFKQTTGLNPDTAWPWCAAFVSFCVQEFDRLSSEIQLPVPPRFAAVKDFEPWGRNEGCVVFEPGDPMYKPQAGDIVIFKFSHIGIVVWNFGDGTIRTVEGNTNEEGSREGDGVYERRRLISKTRLFIRLPARATI